MVENWFKGDLMWWGPWPAHVAGWWQQSQQHDNVLFVSFETMKSDLPRIVRQVAAFLGIGELDDHELAEVVRKCGFEYMKAHATAFEMNPPHLLQTEAELFFRKGARREVSADVRERVAQWCRDGLAGAAFPVAEFYPDVAGDPSAVP